MKIVHQPKIKPQGVRWITVLVSSVLGTALLVLALVQGAHQFGILEKADVLMKDIRGSEHVYDGSTYHNFTMPMPKFKESANRHNNVLAQANSM
ncbi:hypothetical protein [Desulfovibrio inopinatus]|uniref:hypothetical protein n=1 Tax=Desulfovibrio inopinatus TaxID=102109 RepID=UPI0003FCB3EC|nr:hypothetical protein [Desulfovibrio inopinatus]